MEKFKKILSTISVGVLCAIPMVNGIAANAASHDTYVLYHDVQNPNIAYFDFTISYDSSVIANQA